MTASRRILETLRTSRASFASNRGKAARAAGGAAVLVALVAFLSIAILHAPVATTPTAPTSKTTATPRANHQQPSIKVPNIPTPRIVHMPTADLANAASNAVGNAGPTTTSLKCALLDACDLRYDGGPVIHDQVSYAIFWGAGWETSSGRLNKTGQVVTSYFDDMGGTTFQQILTQYSDKTGAVQNTERLGGVWIDPSTPQVDASCGAQTIEDFSIQAEALHAIAVNHWPTDTKNAVYFVYTPAGYLVNDGTNACSNKVFCAYHGWSSTKTRLYYAAMVYPNDKHECANLPSSPNGDLAGDALANITSHEQFEAISDPQVGNGWMDAKGDEIGDKCAWRFAAGGVHLNGGAYELQLEYSNRTHSCVRGA